METDSSLSSLNESRRAVGESPVKLYSVSCDQKIRYGKRKMQKFNLNVKAKFAKVYQVDEISELVDTNKVTILDRTTRFWFRNSIAYHFVCSANIILLLTSYRLLTCISVLWYNRNRELFISLCVGVSNTDQKRSCVGVRFYMNEEMLVDQAPFAGCTIDLVKAYLSKWLLILYSMQHSISPAIVTMWCW